MENSNSTENAATIKPDAVIPPDTVADPFSNQEYLQRKLYFLLEHLKKMHGDLPE